MVSHHLAQLNIGMVKAPLDSPIMAGFVANLDQINALAEAAPGFIWRLQSAAGNATDLRPLGDDTIVNLSVWADVAALEHFTYHSAHVAMMRRRRAWFEPIQRPHLVLWWVPIGHEPTIPEALARLALLTEHGPTPAAFTFLTPYTPIDQEATEEAMPLDPRICGS